MSFRSSPSFIYFTIYSLLFIADAFYKQDTFYYIYSVIAGVLLLPSCFSLLSKVFHRSNNSVKKAASS